MKQEKTQTTDPKKLKKEELCYIMSLCDRYLQFKERTQSCYEQLTISQKQFGQVRHISPDGRERALAALSDAKTECIRRRKLLIKIRHTLLCIIRETPLLTYEEKLTLFDRIGQGKTIREIAKQNGKTDAAIIKRIKKCGDKLCKEEESGKFYECVTRLQKLTKEEA